MNSTYVTLVALLQFAALWVFLAFVVKDYARDRLRQNLFVIRDGLFDQARQSEDGFADRDYLHLRSYINQVIRRGHMVTISRSWLFSLIVRVKWLTGTPNYAEIRKAADEEIRWMDEREKANATLKDTRKKVHMQLVQYHLLTSPVFALAITLAVCAVICLLGFSGLKKSVQSAYDRYFAADLDRGISACDVESGDYLLA